MMFMKKNGGFTLVELIVVIAILAILAGVAVPAYSGYVEKANTAADESLLASVNTAFAAACAFNGEDHVGRNGVSASIGNNDVTVSTGVEAINKSFGEFFEGGQFETVNALYYNKNGMFEFGVSSGGITVSKAAVEKILNSALGEELTSEEIITLLGTTKDYVLGKAVYLDNIIADKEFAALASKALGQDYQNLLNAEAEKLAQAAGGYIGNWKDLSQEEKMMWMSMQEDQAKKNVGSQTALLVAAQGASGQKDAVLSGLQSNPGAMVESIKESMKKSEADGGDPISGLSQAAVAYGLYASYVTSQGGTPDPVTAWEDMKTNTGFHSYLNGTLAGTDVQADMDGFMASMDVLSNLDSDTANKVVQNGVNDAGLQQALKDILGK